MTDKQKFITETECGESASLMRRKYVTYLNDRFFEISATYDKTGVYLKVTLRNSTDSFHYPVESRLALAENKLSEREAALFLIDYIDMYFEEYFRDEAFLPIDWADYSSDETSFQLKGQILNLEVERMANELLKK